MLAWALFGLAALAIGAGLVMTGIKLADGTLEAQTAIGSLAFLPAGIAFSVVGLIVALRRPANPAGWIHARDRRLLERADPAHR